MPSQWNPVQANRLPLGRRASLLVLFVLTVASGAWIYEAFTCGRCWISVHLAPVIIASNLVLTFGGWGLRWLRNYVKTIRAIVHPPHD